MSSRIPEITSSSSSSSVDFTKTQIISSNITRNLDQICVAQPEVTIYRVHSHLRNCNKEAYEPEIIAIGPYHHNKANLKMLQEHKLRYLKSLLQSKKDNVDKYVAAMVGLDKQAKACYAEPVPLVGSGCEFIEMMLLDGCFIIELVRKFNVTHLIEKNDIILNTKWIRNSVQRDLMLFENQIPFFILCKLFDLIEVPNQHDKLIHLLCCFFRRMYPGKLLIKSPNVSADNIKHLLDLIHNDLLQSSNLFISDHMRGNQRKRLHSINNATDLREANVKFERSERDTFFDVSFKGGTMLLPPLTISNRTESFFRNLVAHEQYFQDARPSFVTDYMVLLDCLIDSSEDVKILSHNGIISNCLGDDKVVADMVNKLTDSVTLTSSGFLYSRVFNSVNVHCNKRRNRWMAKLRHNYFSNPWTIISIFAAIFLLLLTITQAVTSILQVV